MNPITRELVTEFHQALHAACGLPALRPSMGDERAWWDFLREMEPLSGDESGPLSSIDIEGAVREMRREKNDGKAGWALRPSTILRNPETFRDMVLIFRSKRRERRLKERCATITAPSTPAPEEPSVSPEEFDAGMAAVRQKLNLCKTESTSNATLPPTGQRSETPEGPGRDGDKPLMRNRTGDDRAIPDSTIGGNTFQGGAR